MPLRKADTSATRKFDDGADWIVLRVVLSKGEADHIQELTSSYHLDPVAMAAAGPDQAATVEVQAQVAQTNRALFQILCVDWSLGDVSADAYSALDEESGEWVDDCIQAVLRERRQRAEKNGRSSAKPRKRASSQPAAAE